MPDFGGNPIAHRKQKNRLRKAKAKIKVQSGVLKVRCPVATAGDTKEPSRTIGKVIDLTVGARATQGGQTLKSCCLSSLCMAEEVIGPGRRVLSLRDTVTHLHSQAYIAKGMMAFTLTNTRTKICLQLHEMTPGS